MIEQLGNEYEAQLTRMAMIGTCVIDDAGLRSRCGNDHGVPGRRLAKLTVKKKVTCLGSAHIATDEKGVAFDQGFGVGKLREAAVT